MTEVAQQVTGLKVGCKHTEAPTCDRLVAYCKIDGSDFGKYIMDNASCVVWEKFDVRDRY